MGGEARDVDLRSTREIKQRLHRMARLSGCSQGRTLRQIRKDKYKGWKARSGDTRADVLKCPPYPPPGCMPCRAVCSRFTARARHEAARNGSDQSTAIRWHSLSRAEQGVDSLGTRRPLRPVVTHIRMPTAAMLSLQISLRAGLQLPFVTASPPT